MFRCACFLALLAFVSAQIPSLGFCPTYSSKENFEMNKFLGKWYEAERYFTLNDIGSRCVVTDYAKTATGKIYVSNEYISRLTGVTRVVNGNVQQDAREGEGKIKVKYNTQPFATETTLVVLDTDYDSYAVVWSCTGLGLVHAENAWLLTRERLPTSPILQKAYGVLDKFRINRSFFVTTQQDGCPLAASDLNAAQGINPISTVVEQTGEEQRNKVITKTALPEETTSTTDESASFIPQVEDAEEVAEDAPIRTVNELIAETNNANDDGEEEDAIVVKAVDDVVDEKLTNKEKIQQNFVKP